MVRYDATPSVAYDGTNHVSVGILAFVVFGGLIFELLSRIFYK